MSAMSACKCTGQAFYALKCADIPGDIFSRVHCSKHTPEAPEHSSCTESWVSLILSSDTAVRQLVPIDSWPRVYHGTTVSSVRLIIIHGMVLNSGDYLCDGTILGKRRNLSDPQHSIWTHPQPGGAKRAAEVKTADDGQTRFKIVVRLRQQPGTYVVHDKGTTHAFDIWSTERRGALILESLEVYVRKSKDQLAIPALLPDPVNLYLTTFKCPVQQHMFNVLQLLKIPQCMFDMNNNRCYCSTCYPDPWKSSMDVAGETYAIPRGWMRFGMLVDPVFAKVNDIWKSWQIAFHGCHPKNVVSILKNRMLLIPHDILPDGKKLQVFSSADKNQDKYFLSPAIGYSAHPWYAKPVPFTDTDGKRKYFQTVLVFKVGHAFNVSRWLADNIKSLSNCIGLHTYYSFHFHVFNVPGILQLDLRNTPI